MRKVRFLPRDDLADCAEPGLVTFAVCTLQQDPIFMRMTRVLYLAWRQKYFATQVTVFHTRDLLGLVVPNLGDIFTAVPKATRRRKWREPVRALVSKPSHPYDITCNTRVNQGEFQRTLPPLLLYQTWFCFSVRNICTGRAQDGRSR